MACIRATVQIPTYSAEVALPTYGAEVNVDLRDLLPRAHLARAEDAVEVYDPGNILTVVETTDGGLRLGVSGAEGCGDPSTGATLSIRLRDIAGREVGPMQSSGLRSPMLAHFIAEEIEGWLSKADGAGGTYWIGLADGPLSECQNAMLWMVRNDEAGKQRVGLHSKSNGAWQAVSLANTAHEDIVGVAGGGGSHTAANRMNVLGFTTPLGNDALVSHSYWVTNYGGLTLAPGKVPYLLVGAGCDGTSDTVTVKARAVAVVTANPDNLVPVGTPPTYVPARRSYPLFSDAIASADPSGIIAEAVDLPNGTKRITFNSTTDTLTSGTDMAFWAWPFEDLYGRTEFDMDDLTDLRKWSGRPWLEMLGVPANAPHGWFASAGILFGSELSESSQGLAAGVSWAHPWLWPRCQLNFCNDSGSWGHNEGAPRDAEGYIGELSWTERGEWLAYPHAVSKTRGGEPYDSYAMGGGAQNPIKMPHANPMYLVLVVGNHSGTGPADSVVFRPYHDFQKKRF